jgi:hypothetical protein
VSDDDMIYPTKKNMPMIWQMFKSHQSTAEAIYKSGMKIAHSWDLTRDSMVDENSHDIGIPLRIPAEYINLDEP